MGKVISFVAERGTGDLKVYEGETCGVERKQQVVAMRTGATLMPLMDSEGREFIAEWEDWFDRHVLEEWGTVYNCSVVEVSDVYSRVRKLG